MSSKPIQITAMLTCFNRKMLTLACLQAFFDQELPEGVRLDVVLVDDGSSDGTGDAIRAAFSKAQVLEGDGSLFWCGGMCKAWEQAESANPDYLLMLNDDTTLHPGAIRELLQLAPAADCPVIAVGAISDPDSGELSYGGRLRSHPKGPAPLKETPVKCDTFNGNCVLIPRVVRERLGSLYSGYTHSFADFDYGIQATRCGIDVLQSSKVVGICRPNSNENTWQDAKLGRLQRLKKLNSPKGLPWRDHLAFARRTQKGNWLRHFVAPYARILLGR
ncbi:glycosyltransferase family 2 protein [Coraliomargarita parva]|uniref:glycosyltransferase family 2 protein n=1 Tax=Coraliomargarita parva TaxID=3014050 RepID=UPI0022B56A78|nr:glycosyltransferase family 2 protein [Coraliomargarita parva]